jgi:hypothetical protein
VSNRLLRYFDSGQIKCEIDEELRFHLELLTEALQQRDMPLAHAKDAALERFGNVDQIRTQCIEISRRNRPALRALKSLLVVIVLTGVLVRVLGTEFHVTRLGDLLITVGILGRLLVYVRGLNPSFLSRAETSSPLKLNENGRRSIVAYDESMRTPVERIISDK